MVPQFVSSAGEGVDFFSVGGHQWRKYTWSCGGASFQIIDFPTVSLHPAIWIPEPMQAFLASVWGFLTFQEAEAFTFQIG